MVAASSYLSHQNQQKELAFLSRWLFISSSHVGLSCSRFSSTAEMDLPLLPVVWLAPSDSWLWLIPPQSLILTDSWNLLLWNEGNQEQGILRWTSPITSLISFCDGILLDNNHIFLGHPRPFVKDSNADLHESLDILINSWRGLRIKENKYQGWWIRSSGE